MLARSYYKLREKDFKFYLKELSSDALGQRPQDYPGLFPKVTHPVPCRTKKANRMLPLLGNEIKTIILHVFKTHTSWYL